MLQSQSRDARGCLCRFYEVLDLECKQRDRAHDVVVLPIAKRSKTESAMQAAAQLDGRQQDVVNN